MVEMGDFTEVDFRGRSIARLRGLLLRFRESRLLKQTHLSDLITQSLASSLLVATHHEVVTLT
jgi:hypothetical protein